MAISKQKRMPLDIAADSASSDSLSFAGFVCIQDKYGTTQKNHVRPTQVNKQELDFEFSVTTPRSRTERPINIVSADLLSSKGQFQKKETPDRSDQFQVFGKRRSNLLPPSQNSSRRSNAKEPNVEKNAVGPNDGVSNRDYKKISSGKTWFSFIAPCRNCRAQEPSLDVNEQVLRRGNI